MRNQLDEAKVKKVQVPFLRQDFFKKSESSKPRAHPHKRQAVPLQPLRQAIQDPWESKRPSETPHRRKAVLMPALPSEVLSKKLAHNSHGQEAQ